MKIIIATGGSGGHIFPAINVAVKLKRDGHDVQFVGRFGQAVEQIKKKGFGFTELEIYGLSKETFWRSLRTIIKSTWACYKMLRTLNPDIVIGFGGYGSFPAVMAAVLLRRPTLIHEQNVLPGRANALLARFVDKIAISFDKSNNYFSRSKTVLTGCPCRYNAKQVGRSEYLSKMGLKEDKLTILIFGGSQGSHRINMEFIEAAKILKDQLNFQVIHVTGQKDFQTVLKQYPLIGVPHVVFEFLDDISNAYHVADLVISRAGAGTVTEIALFGKPAVLVPYPFAGAHQRDNALMLEDIGLAKMIEEKNLTPDNLNQAILHFLPNKPQIKELEKKIKAMCFPDAVSNLAKEAMSLIK
jgi:UDP-N-acetylglucosamine--N-acetylmuramyl-(pentapeptide) pyrophosphoryl-undecaprenol N-acetylglucosamine transferase